MNGRPEMEKMAYPTQWQRKVIWAAVAFVSVFVIAALSVFMVKVVVDVISYLQPLLTPIAIAGVLAFLLEPVVRKLCDWGVARLRAVILVFLLVIVGFGSLLVWIIPEVYDQGVKLAQRMPGYTVAVRGQVAEFVNTQGARFGIKPMVVPAAASGGEEETAGEDAEDPGESSEAGTVPSGETTDLEPYLEKAGDYLQDNLPTLLEKTGRFLHRSIGGFLGVFGFLLGMVLVPVYLFFFLLEAPKIAGGWSRYLPLRASHFKDEVVSTLMEINGYLINFFRGQLLVSLIDGALTAVALLILGLDYALLIGLMVGIIGLIPYVGIMLCWAPAVLIAAVQWQGDWFYPVVVTVIFIAVQQIDGLLIAPKIVGNSVGLHPMTVIVSLFAWSLLLGGLLGAILAVPLTATLKVLLKRYVWEKRRVPSPGGVAPSPEPA